MTAKDRNEFNAYLRACTDDQGRGVLDREKAANRRAFASLASAEMARRGIHA